MKWVWIVFMATGLAFMVYQLFWWEKPEECRNLLPKQEIPEGVKCP